MDLSTQVRSLLLDAQADLVGFGDLTELPAAGRQGLPIGISVAVKYPKQVIAGIAELPTPQYYEYYNTINEQLDQMVSFCAEYLRSCGYKAIPQTLDYVDSFGLALSSPLPHKTVATRAGLGWIGKCALLVTKQFGSMIRLSSLLTDAPLDTAAPVDKSSCGSCTECVEACPGGAVSGQQWYAGLERDSFFDAAACQKAARERALLGLGMERTVCGKCIVVCPFTRRYINKSGCDA